MMKFVPALPVLIVAVLPSPGSEIEPLSGPTLVSAVFARFSTTAGLGPEFGLLTANAPAEPIGFR